MSMNEHQLNDLLLRGMEEKHCGDARVGEEILKAWELESKKKERDDKINLFLFIIGLVIIEAALAAYVWVGVSAMP